MSYTIVAGDTLDIADTGTTSTVLKSREGYDGAYDITLFAPSNATAGKLQVSDDPDAASPAWFDLKEVIGAGTLQNVASPPASSARTYRIVAKGLRLVTAAVTLAASYKTNIGELIDS